MKEELRPISNQRVLAEAIKSAVLECILKGFALDGYSAAQVCECVANTLRLRRFDIPQFEVMFGQARATTAWGFRLQMSVALAEINAEACSLVIARLGPERFNPVTHWDYEEMQGNDWHKPATR